MHRRIETRRRRIAMQDIAIEPDPAAEAPGDPESAPEAPVELAFTDALGAAQWMKSLPLSSVAQAYDALLGQLRALTASEIGPRDRATIAELAREPVAHLHTELARRYAGRPQPLDEREADAAEQAVALWQALWIQYSVCLRPLLEGRTELKGVKAKLLQRALYVGKQLIVAHGLARRVPAADLWQELHAYYRLAEMLDCTMARVSDHLMPDAEGLSCYSTYSHALLLALADPYSLTVRQIELVDRWLGQWARKVFPYVKQRESEGPVIVIDLEGAHGAVLAASTSAAQGASVRFGYPAKLATSVRGRLKRLAGGTTPAELQLGDDVSSEAATVLLTHLDAHWQHVPAGAQRKRSTAVEIVAGGIEAGYFRVGGRSFRRVDPLGRDTDVTKYLQTVGGISDFDRRKDESERSWPWEKWYGACEWREASVRHQSGGAYHWFLDELVVVREEGQVRLGYVSRVAIDPDGGVALSLKLWAGDPGVHAVRLVNPNGSEEPPVPALILSETPEEPTTLVMSPRAFIPNRIMRCDESGPVRKFKLTHIVQRGGDFERVAFEAVDPNY
jgi:cyclic-di-GMP-binding protein